MKIKKQFRGRLSGPDHAADETIECDAGLLSWALFFSSYILMISPNQSLPRFVFVRLTVVYLTVNSFTDFKTLQGDLQKLQSWVKQWDMEFKLRKYQVSYTSHSNNLNKFLYKLHGQILSPV